MAVALEPRYGMPGPTHLGDEYPRPATVTYCGIPAEPFIRRDMTKIKQADRCEPCWRECRMRHAAQMALQDQWYAANG